MSTDRSISPTPSARDRARLLLVKTLASGLRPLVNVPAPARPQRILVIKPDHLGDVLLLTPALRALRAALPEAKIAALVGPWAQRLLADNDDVDTVLTCPFPGFVRGERAHPLQPYALLARYGALLRAGAFDTAIIARDDHWWGGLLALAAGIPQRAGYAHPLVAPTLTRALPWDGTAHVTQQALDLVQSVVGVSPGAPPLRFFPSAEEHRWAESWRGTHSPERPLIAIQPGAGGHAKLWPAQAWAAVAQALAPVATVVLTGGPDDRAEVAAISAALATPHHQLVGEVGLGGLAALFSRCALVLGVDNGPLHLAVSQGTPTVQIFGPGSVERFGPWGDRQRHRVLRADLWCSPCGVLTHCPRGTKPSECMTAVSVAAVIAAAQHTLSLAE